MTTVRIDLRDPSLTGPDVPVTGVVDWTPTRRRRVEGDDGPHVTLPTGRRARIDGAAVTVDVDPTGPHWCWRVDERVPGGTTRWVAVPEAGGVVPYADLVDVDPGTLDPLDPPPPSVVDVLAQAAQARDDAQTAAQDAGGSATVATAARDQAVAAAGTASGAADAASGAAGAAIGAASSALTSASDATYQAGVASSAATAALGHASDALYQAGAATTAATDAAAAATTAGASATTATGAATAAAADAGAAGAAAAAAADAQGAAEAAEVHDAGRHSDILANPARHRRAFCLERQARRSYNGGGIRCQFPRRNSATEHGGHSGGGEGTAGTDRFQRRKDHHPVLV